MSPSDELAGQRATILGLAREGTALARYLARHGARVTVSDLRSAEALAGHIELLAGIDVQFALGGHPEHVLDTDIVYASPGVPPDAPVLVAARRRSIPVSSATELFFERCAAPIVGITGSSGKTTTVALVGDMLSRSGIRTWVGGNIGRPLVDELDRIRARDRVVLELSSFQLEGLRTSPSVAAVLNLTPDHLDRHPSLEAYREAKAQIMRHQGASDYLVANRDDLEVRAMVRGANAHVLWFSLAGEPNGEGAYLAGDELRVRWRGTESVVCTSADLRLRGRHNLANVLAAAAASMATGANGRAISRAAAAFTGIPHRLEIVGQAGGATYVDDSIATTPVRSVAAMRSFDPPLVLLAGGRHKNLPLQDWALAAHELLEHLVVFGEAAAELAQAAQEAGAPPPQIHRAETLSDAVRAAAAAATTGATVLLSPACTSFDAFADYVERGLRFREDVSRLPGATSAQ